jgi:hypothetical protein
MRIDHLPELATPSFALHTITSIPLDPDFPLFNQYPAMKLGVRDSVRHYANLLAPLAETMMASLPGTTDWVVTAPPLYAIPAGANLLAWETSRILKMRIPRKSSLWMADLRYSLANPQSQDFTSRGEYSSSGVAERIANRRRLLEGDWAPRPDPADFRGRAVLVINDINVTGTQQVFLQRVIETAQPASIHWLYIFQVEAALGRSKPELEYSLNHLNLDTFEDFAEIVARADIDYTSRCISRLLRYPEAMLAPLIRSLDDERRKRLRELIIAEGAFLRDEIQSKVDLLQKPGTG